MQILDDKNIVNHGDMPKRIAALRKKVEQLIKENNQKIATDKKPEPLIQTNSDKSDELVQENTLLKKQIIDKNKTIKELNFKLEMFKLAKSLRQGAGIDTKSEELKKIINEYIKEIDKSISSLNIE